MCTGFTTPREPLKLRGSCAEYRGCVRARARGERVVSQGVVRGVQGVVHGLLALVKGVVARTDLGSSGVMGFVARVLEGVIEDKRLAARGWCKSKGCGGTVKGVKEPGRWHNSSTFVFCPGDCSIESEPSPTSAYACREVGRQEVGMCSTRGGS